MRRILFHAALLGTASCTVRTEAHSEAGREFAQRLCAVQNDCNCAEDLLIPDCEDRVERAFAKNERRALNAGLVYDSACMEDMLGRIDALGTCESSYPEFGPLCAVYGGNRDVGEPCELFDLFPLMYGCRLDLTCIDGVCAEVPPWLPQGAICSEDQFFVPTGDLGQCDEGLRCDSLDTRTCVPVTPIPQAPLGEECTELGGCMDDNVCRPQGDDLGPSEERPGVCIERTLPGEPCTLFYECTWTCENGYCQARPPRLCGALESWSELHESS